MTKKYALKMTSIHWHIIAKKGYTSKELILGVDRFKYECPCCEYTVVGKSVNFIGGPCEEHCPMIEIWGNRYCEDHGTFFDKWGETGSPVYALAIAEGADKLLKELQ